MILDKVRQSLDDFCVEFVKSPYLCYTEHGLHVRFCSILSERLTEQEMYGKLGDDTVCVIQKEYRTAHNLGKSKCQHWDVAVLRDPLTASSKPEYDHLMIEAAIEFGLNEGKKHLCEDIRRLSHPLSNVESGFAVHLYRVSESMSKRDKNPKSRMIWPRDDLSDLKKLVVDSDVSVYYALVDRTGTLRSRAYRIDDGGVHDLISDA